MSLADSLHLLIVDDEVLETEYLLTMLQETPFSFRNISVAFSMESAMGILEHHQVDLILCDIEMPRGTGLDLLRWVRERGIPAEALIITCHPEFHYAQQAMKLSSVDYLLKPIGTDQLSQGLSRAVELIHRNRAARQYFCNEEKLRDIFFQDLMEGNLLESRSEILGRAASMGLELPEEKMVSLYFRLDYLEKKTGNGQIFARRTVLVNVVQDILFDFRLVPWIFFPEEEAFFVAFRLSDLRGTLGGFCESRIRRLMAGSRDLLQLSMACFVGRLASFWELPDCYRTLRERSGCMLFCCGGIHIHPAADSPPGNKTLPGLHCGEWGLMLEHGKLDRMCGEVEQYLARLLERGLATSTEVFRFSQDLTRTVLRFLAREGMEVEAVLTGAQQQELLPRGGSFLEDYVEAARALLERLKEEWDRLHSGDAVTGQISRYVESHVEEDLNRQTLARQFGLSPEYLSRLFHQNTGTSLVSFITQTKLEFCRRMFETTSCTVRQAAERVGYTNFSYFSKLFRERYGCTPQQYKERIADQRE